MDTRDTQVVRVGERLRVDVQARDAMMCGVSTVDVVSNPVQEEGAGNDRCLNIRKMWNRGKLERTNCPSKRIIPLRGSGVGGAD
jgi:hypothetical protein